MKKTSRASTRYRPTQLVLWALLAGLLLSPGGCLWQKEPQVAQVRRRLLEGARVSMVKVRIYFKRDIDNEFSSDDQEVSFQERLARRMVDRQMSLDLGGVVLDDQGHILIADPETEQRFIDRIEVIGPDGQLRRARLLTILKKMDAAVLKVSDPLGLVPIVFTESKELEELIRSQTPMKTKLPPLQLVSIYRSGRDWHIRRSSLAGSFRYDSSETAPEYFLGATSGGSSTELSSGETMGVSPSLIADKDGKFIGLTMRGTLDLKQKYRIWRGKDVLAAIDDDLNVDEFRNSRQALKKKYAQLYHQIKIYYRQPSKEEYGGGPLPERIVYGLAIDDTTLLVPLEMSRREAKQIESIEVQLNGPSGAAEVGESPADSEPKTSAGEFVGGYRDFAAFVVRVKDARFDKWLDLDRLGRISKVVPVQTVYARRRFGRKNIDVWYARCLREAKGYGDAVHLQPSLPIFAGAMLLDLDGRLAGFYLRERLPAEEQKIMSRLGPEYYNLARPGYAPSGTGMRRIFRIAEIASALRQPGDAFDPNIRSMTKTQARRRMWLGIEYVPLNRELAKRVDLEALTKDGSVGFVVSVVYQGSPAAEMGIQSGDILLRIKDTSSKDPYPTELRSRMAGGIRGGYGFRVWRSRQNFLTEFLAAIGQDHPIEVTFCSQRGEQGWKLFTKTIKVQQAPLDYDSAERYRDRPIGLTVRDLTYEIRQALKMSPDDPGVVVSKIREGTPAAIAKISESELITRISSEEVFSVADFEAKIVAARQAKLDTVKVEILRLGQTRVADLSLSE